MILYTPSRIEKPKNLIDVPSAWKGLEYIIKDIIIMFEVKNDKALEFGVEFGFSTVALSNYFTKVIGVDTFEGDEHTLDKNIEGLYEAVQSVMPPNVVLIKSDYKDYKDDEIYDMIHVDIVHTYADTFNCGDWALNHSNLVIFHDTESFKDVRKAVEDLSVKHNAIFYNYPFYHGLGILWKSQSSYPTEYLKTLLRPSQASKINRTATLIP